MKKLFLLLVVVSVGLMVQAQDEEEKKIEKPKNINVHDFDEFKNSAFNIYEKSLHYKKMVDGDEGLSVDDITGAKKLTNDVATLSKKADALLDKAKNVKPRTKSPAAVKNTKKSVDALNAAKKNLEYIFERIGGKD